MSNQLPTTMTQGNFALPAHLQQKEARVASAGSEYLPYISLRNGQFVPMMGKEAMQPLPAPLNVIILDFQPDVGRVFYAGAYDPSKSNVTPDCWSVDGKAPDAGCVARQAPQCSTCPQNAKGSAMNGRAKACSFNRRLVVMVPGYDTPFMLKLGGMSLFGDANAQGNVFKFQNFAKQLQSGFGQPVDPSWVWTQISYDPKASVPALNFGFGVDASNNTFLNAEQIALVDQVREQHAAEIAEAVAGTYAARTNNDADGGGATGTDANGAQTQQTFAANPAQPVQHAQTNFAATPVNTMHQPSTADTSLQTTQPATFAQTQQAAAGAGVAMQGAAGFTQAGNTPAPALDQSAVGAVEAGQVAATETVQTQAVGQTQDALGLGAPATQQAQQTQVQPDAGATSQGVLGVLAQLDQTAANATS